MKAVLFIAWLVLCGVHGVAVTTLGIIWWKMWVSDITFILLVSFLGCRVFSFHVKENDVKILDEIDVVDGWMCSVDFDHELRSADGGARVYPSEDNCKKHRKCCANDSDTFCHVQHVMVMTHEDFEKLVAALETRP